MSDTHIKAHLIIFPIFPHTVHDRQIENHRKINFNSLSCEERVRINIAPDEAKIKSHPSHSNDQCEPGSSYDHKNVQTDKSSANNFGEGSRMNLGSSDYSGNKDTEMVAVDERRPARSKIYCGLLFIEQLRNVKETPASDFFVTYEGFWNQCLESTEVTVELVLSYLKVGTLF